MQYGQRDSDFNVTVWGADRDCQLLAQQFNFMLLCRPASHTTLYEPLEGLDPPTVTTQQWPGKVEETDTYRCLNGVPLQDGDEALLVNWCERTVSCPDGKVVYKNAGATTYPLSDDLMAGVILADRTRWKVEIENNNTLKTKGDNREHNFGHDQQLLASVLATPNILPLLFLTWLERLDEKYKRLRSYLPTRKTFFEDLRALTRSLYSEGWGHRLTLMLEGLGLEIPLNTS